VAGYVGSYWSEYPSPNNSDSPVGATPTHGRNELVVLTAEPVPEPGSLVLLATGCAACGFGAGAAASPIHAAGRGGRATPKPGHRGVW